MKLGPAMPGAAVLMCVLALSGCDHSEQDRSPIVSETREAGEFDSISLRGSAQLEVQIGSPASISIEGRQRTLSHVSTDVDDDTLMIRTSRKGWVSDDLKIKVTVPKLAELRLEGGNDVRLVGFDGGTATIDIEGAANIHATGRLDELTVHMSGAGRADLRELVTNDAKVTVDGVGSVHVNSTGSLDATMNGVGAILYSGSPHSVSTSMNGIGTISRDRKRSQPEAEQNAPIDPDTLQPEYEKNEVATGLTEVI